MDHHFKQHHHQLEPQQPSGLEKNSSLSVSLSPKNFEQKQQRQQQVNFSSLSDPIVSSTEISITSSSNKTTQCLEKNIEYPSMPLSKTKTSTTTAITTKTSIESNANDGIDDQNDGRSSKEIMNQDRKFDYDSFESLRIARGSVTTATTSSMTITPTTTTAMNQKSVCFHSKTAQSLSMKKINNAIDCLQYMINGSTLTKIKSNMRQYRRFFVLEEDLSSIRWSPSSKKTSKARLPVKSIREVRRGKNTGVLKNPDLIGIYRDECSFSIIYGEEFESIDLIALSSTEANIWVIGLNFLIGLIRSPDSLEGRERMREKWLLDVFDEADSDHKGMLDELETIAVLKKLNERLDIDCLKQKILEFELNKKNGEQRGCISKHAFISLFTQTATRPDIYFLLVRYCGREYMTVEELQLFLEGEQGICGTSLELCTKLIEHFEPSQEARRKNQFLIDGFTEFLISNICDIMSNSNVMIDENDDDEDNETMNNEAIETILNNDDDDDTDMVESSIKSASSSRRSSNRSGELHNHHHHHHQNIINENVTETIRDYYRMSAYQSYLNETETFDYDLNEYSKTLLSGSRALRINIIEKEQEDPNLDHIKSEKLSTQNSDNSDDFKHRSDSSRIFVLGTPSSSSPSMTSRLSSNKYIPLDLVLKRIQENAFISSPYPVILHLVNFNERSISSEGQHIIASEILKIFGKNFFVLNSESTDNDNEKHLKNYPSSSLQNESVRREDIKESSVLMKLCDIDRNSIKSTSKSSTLDCEMSKNDDDDGPIMITPKQNQSFETSKLDYNHNHHQNH
ncbi:Inactive phospholipase C-like protein 2 [Sarcoptes scabiei]|uniref:Inactive phospholipase C-like protein 2 n=1 Tax=Sarcoptes scabiei TaxID=52283 RepID=A0A834RD28_SARSC|nr:Inactive phospholipase C-like protein 2 [Sarcoptes scabiei]